MDDSKLATDIESREFWAGLIPLQLAVKRGLDFALAIPTLIVLSPVFGLIALLIKIESGGSIFHNEERLGRRGRRFLCIKFRTMIPENDVVLEGYLQSNPDAAREWKQFRKLRGHDPRVTRVGRFLRRFSIDEMPQVINIIKGDMSVVGPRPFLPRELPDIGSAAEVILSFKPGMAGMWVASGRNGLPFSDRIKLEQYYVIHWSLWLDFVLLLKTLRILVTDKNAV